MYHTIILGAGQAGLAAAYYLKRAGKKILVLESNARIGDNWRKRWESLQLFTPQRYNGLPGLAPTGSDWELIDRLEVANYLERYVETFSLPVQLHRTCVSAQKTDAWEIRTNAETYQAERLIVATGAYKDPVVPAVAKQFPASIAQLHSSEVRDLKDLVGSATSLLIVGAGASGQQLARLGAAAGAKVTLVGPKVANLPRNFLGKDIYWWLHNSGMMSVRTDSKIGKMLTNEKKGIITVGDGPMPPGVQRISTHVNGYAEGQLKFRTAKAEQAPLRWPGNNKKGVIIWCTGYRNRYPFLPEELLNDAGQPLQKSGLSTVDETVAFVGLENLRRPGSSLLGGVGKDAGEIVRELG
ncbi:NAD(P)-binding domain-containing protein [Lewinella sp. 4G2]|uniref:NAD(P)-binding domain-containing protein n=1 Tax=Lewinella sp. 4G2 TaxID=1803372 RepID=UPI0018D28E47|nr:NAD(P)/FAD-dependent oxidoreductase [Lewinella sp. 4G2]